MGEKLTVRFRTAYQIAAIQAVAVSGRNRNGGCGQSRRGATFIACPGLSCLRTLVTHAGMPISVRLFANTFLNESKAHG